MTIHWECPDCGDTYPETAWTIAGAWRRPSLLRRVTALVTRRSVSGRYHLTHTCPEGHTHPGGSPYRLSGHLPSTSRAVLPDGTPQTFFSLFTPGRRPRLTALRRSTHTR
ncbi:hypothetical protein LO762_20520 [Actinocorallia sp. API 0066]|uniref:hypothetical protein n=1 Tax=Actinocorallia sp. API 0066 TaxID=2896846 RepID=UPI001E4324B7|nr:hypothetical protein [Actinocorallia sp. API 0066]MCD0451561.1 hypothetical protein [Actinocorallia sp. API 0066]